MWVYEEEIEGRKLTEIINTDHVNVKYLPDVKLPGNVVAIPDLAEAVKGATIIVFVLPHQVRRAAGRETGIAALTRHGPGLQFLHRLLPTIKANLHPRARAISLIKVRVAQHHPRAAQTPSLTLALVRASTLTTRGSSLSATLSATASASRPPSSWAPTWRARSPRTSSRRPQSGARARRRVSSTPASSKPCTST